MFLSLYLQSKASSDFSSKKLGNFRILSIGLSSGSEIPKRFKQLLFLQSLTTFRCLRIYMLNLQIILTNLNSFCYDLLLTIDSFANDRINLNYCLKSLKVISLQSLNRLAYFLLNFSQHFNFLQNFLSESVQGYPQHYIC